MSKMQIPKFMIVEFFQDFDNSYRYRIKSRNGQEKLCSCSYSSYRKCIEGWRTVQETLRINEYFVSYRFGRGIE